MFFPGDDTPIQSSQPNLYASFDRRRREEPSQDRLESRSVVFDNTDDAEAEETTDEIPLQPVTIYTPTYPPSKKRKERKREILYATDGFTPPLSDLLGANSSSVCILCKFIPITTGENGEMILKMYKDWYQSLDTIVVYKMIVDFWNENVAGSEYMEGSDGTRDKAEDSPRMRPRKRRRETSRYPEECSDEESIDDDSSGEESSIRSKAPSRVKARIISQYIRDKWGGEEASSPDLASSGTSDSQTPLKDSNAEDMLIIESDKDKTTQTRKIPEINKSIVDHHFQNCCKETNVLKVLTDQLEILKEMQTTICNSGMYCTRESQNQAAPTEAQSQISESEKELDVVCFKELETQIQAEVVYLKNFKGTILKLKPKLCENPDDIKLYKTLVEDYKSRTKALRESITRYKELKKHIETFSSPKDSAVDTSLPPTTQPAQVGRLCIKLQEATKVQSLAKEIINLSIKIEAIRSKNAAVPFGLSALEYYKKLPAVERTITQNDVYVINKRSKKQIEAYTNASGSDIEALKSRMSKSAYQLTSQNPNSSNPNIRELSTQPNTTASNNKRRGGRVTRSNIGL